MTRKELVEELVARLDKKGISLPKTTVTAVLETIGEMNTGWVMQEIPVPVPGIGLIKSVTRAPRTFRNPVNGGTISVGERKALKLSVSSGMSKQLNALH